MKLHRLRKGRYTTIINGECYTIIHSLHWDIYNDNWERIAFTYTLTDARALLEEIIKGGLPI